uniref:Maf-like protein DDB_G0281937 isoform X5 n=1 Tax=Nicotiana sylvestris TaxID=4096 RepID=A0A1U7W2T4_NICSY|nr:PREDICTED: maf-like protein DDB_G0281937 isoform X5 [Nicotiana sylvestris]
MAPKNLSFKIILGSSSMARRKILADMGYDFTVMTADIDEKSIRKENAEELVVALAEAKADAIMSRLETTDHLEENTHPTLLITADTVAVYQGIIREKPSSKEEARQFIKRSIGNNLSTCTRLLWWSSHGCGICCGDQPHKGDKKRSLGKVYFHEIPDEVIDSLIEEGIILNVAGGLMLEHPLTLPFVDTVIGTADHVMGLPRSLTEKLIQEAL